MGWARMESLQPLQANELLHVRDEKTAATAGGTFTSGAWRTRDLNTVKTNTIGGASVASNQVTLPAGTYWIEASAPAYRVQRHRAKLYNTTASADVILGTSEYIVDTADTAISKSFVRGLFTLSASSVLELQHRGAVTRSSDGFGVDANLGTECYSEVIIWKVA